MKYLIILSLVISVLLVSCSSSTDPEFENQYVTMLKASQKVSDSAVAAVFNDATTAGQNMLKANFNEIAVRAELTTIMGKYPTIAEAVYVNASNIMTHIEPAEYRHTEGTDITAQEHQQQMISTKQNAMSSIFKVVEGYYAIVIAAPIIKDGEMVGSVNLVVKPHEFISFYTDTIIKVSGNFIVDNFFVMETNGTDIYDIDPAQTGKNLFTDSLYLPYPSLKTAAQTIIVGESGQTNYTFLNSAKQKNVTKDVWWRTSSYYGKIWKYCIVKERS